MSKKKSETVKGAPPIRCYACSGTFTLGEGVEGDELVAMHSFPYCAAFEAVETVQEAIEFSQRCRAAAQPS